MILVHRIKGEPLYLNADLIEFVESTPDTVITLADGRKMIVSETAEEIVELSKVFRASVIVASDELGWATHAQGRTRSNAPASPSKVRGQSGILKLLPTATDDQAHAEESED